MQCCDLRVVSTDLYATADKRTGRPVPLAKMHCFRVGVDLLVHVHVMCTYVIVVQISRSRLLLDYCSIVQYMQAEGSVVVCC